MTMQLTPSDAPSLSVYPPWGLSLGKILLRLLSGDYLASGERYPALAKVFGCRMQCVQHYVTASNIALGLRHCEPCSGFHCLDNRITFFPVDMAAAFALSLRLVLSLLSHHDRGSAPTSHLMTMQPTPSDAPSLSVYPPWGLSLGKILLRLLFWDYLVSGDIAPPLLRCSDAGCSVSSITSPPPT